VIPAYVRLAARFTPRERNAFISARSRSTASSCFGWAVAASSWARVVLAPFIALSRSDHPLHAGGLVFPNIRL
jgi:hypothetical protein